MGLLSGLTRNPFLLTGLSSWLIAQVLKVLLHAALTGQLHWERLFGDGGMPSGHSATVTAMATTAALEYGLASPIFAIAVVFGIIVMHDAMGVRREAGKHAKVLNDLIASLGKDAPPKDVLKEFLGHTPLQVCFGALLGFGVALMLG